MQEQSPSMQIINRHLRIRQKHVLINYKMPCCKQCQHIFIYILDFSRWYTIANDRRLHEMLPVLSTSCDLSTCKV